MGQDENLRNRCARGEFYSYGTAKIFEKRAKDIGRRLKAITFLGLLSPVLAGGIAMTFSAESSFLNKIVFPALSIVLLSQSVLSLLSLCYKWEEKHSYSLWAIKNNNKLFNKFSRLSGESDAAIAKKISDYEDEYDHQEAEDSSQGITDKEERYGMRKTLIYFGKACKTCNEKPTSIKPTDCDTCGNF